MKSCDNCGYKGKYGKMSFDVDEAYNYLKKHRFVYTIRPYQASLKPECKHVHRKSKWTGDIVSRLLIESGHGKRDLKQVMQIYYYESGFESVANWIKRLIDMHGEKTTSQFWSIYKVELVKENEPNKK